MAILGPDGHPVGPEAIGYKIGSFGIQTAQPPEYFLQMAVAQASKTMMQQVANPFQLEPAAQAAFMLVAGVLEKQEERIAQLEAKLEGSEKAALDESDS
jgi:hypothetical protein